MRATTPKTLRFLFERQVGLYRSGVRLGGGGKCRSNSFQIVGNGSVGVEVEADVVEPFGDEVFVAGIEDIGIVEEENRCPVDQVAL